MATPASDRCRFRGLLALAACVLLAGCEGTTAARQPTPPLAVTAQEFERWKATRTWRSREELLQFFADNDQSLRARGAVLDQPLLARMATELSTMFPMSGCQRIIYDHGLLHLFFAQAQRVRVPGAYHQVFLVLPQQLDFAVAPPRSPGEPWRFSVERGQVRLEFSWLAKLLGPVFLHDLDVDAFDYRIDREHHHSSLTVTSVIERTGSTLTLNGHAPKDPAATAAYLDHVLLACHLPADRASHEAGTYTERIAFDFEAHAYRVDGRWDPRGTAAPAAAHLPATTSATAPALAPPPAAARK